MCLWCYSCDDDYQRQPMIFGNVPAVQLLYVCTHLLQDVLVVQLLYVCTHAHHVVVTMPHTWSATKCPMEEKRKVRRVPITIDRYMVSVKIPQLYAMLAIMSENSETWLTRKPMMNAVLPFTREMNPEAQVNVGKTQTVRKAMMTPIITALTVMLPSGRSLPRMKKNSTTPKALMGSTKVSICTR